MVGNRRGARDEGSGTVGVLGVLAGAAMLAGALALGAAVDARAVRVQAVADLAALAAGDVSAVAAWTEVGDRPCAHAGQVAAANRMELIDCSVIGSDARVVVGDRLDLGAVAIPVSAPARARPG